MVWSIHGPVDLLKTVLDINDVEGAVRIIGVWHDDPCELSHSGEVELDSA